MIWLSAVVKLCKYMVEEKENLFMKMNESFSEEGPLGGAVGRVSGS